MKAGHRNPLHFIERNLILAPTHTLKTVAKANGEDVEVVQRESAEGLAIELGWVRDTTCDLTEGDYLRMTLRKTCWFFDRPPDSIMSS